MSCRARLWEAGAWKATMHAAAFHPHPQPVHGRTHSFAFLVLGWPQVPRSSRSIAEDNDYALLSVVLFKRVVDDFKAAARSKGYQVPGAPRGTGAHPGHTGAWAGREWGWGQQHKHEGHGHVA